MQNNKTILDYLRISTEFLESKGIESARLNAEHLLCKVMNYQRIELYTNFEKPLSDQEISSYRYLIKERINGKPLQYIIGKTNFLGLEITVDENVLIPRPETEEMVDYIIKDLGLDFSGNILDIGTGSGCIAIALAHKLPNSQVTAIDISDEALSVAKENATKNKITNVNFYKKNIFNTKEPKSTFDVIVSNPPYIAKDEISDLQKEVRNHEPIKALTDEADGLTFYRFYSELFRKLLSVNGTFYLEMGDGQSTRVNNFFVKSGFTTNILKDFTSKERIIKGFFNFS